MLHGFSILGPICTINRTNEPGLLRDPCGQFCVGSNAYTGVGAGAKVCLTDEGFSFCLEGGLGVGGGLEVSPFEDLSKNEMLLEATGKAKLGTSCQASRSRWNSSTAPRVRHPAFRLRPE